MRGVNGGAGRAVAWPGGEAVMAPRRAGRWWRGCRAGGRSEQGPACALERGGESAARHRLRSAAVAQRAGGSGAASARACALKCLRTQRGERRARERGEREREWREKERVIVLT